MPTNKPKIAFFGTPEFAVWVLDGLAERGIMPDLIVCAPDAPKGRKLVMTPPPAKAWADAHGIKTIQPEKIRTPEFAAQLSSLAPDRDNSMRWDLFIVAAYGKIIPENILYMPTHKTINVHPSLLPLLRGSSPLQSAIARDIKDTGVTIMLLDKDMDHGPILAAQKQSLADWPVDANTLGLALAKDGANLIADIMPALLAGTQPTLEQDHSKATFTEKLAKEDGLMDLSADGYQNFLKYNAYKGWPGSYFFVEKDGKQLRVSITNAAYEEKAFKPLSVIVEGRDEISWDEFCARYRQ